MKQPIQASSKPKGSKSLRLQEPKNNLDQTNVLMLAMILEGILVEQTLKHAALVKITAQDT